MGRRRRVGGIYPAYQRRDPGHETARRTAWPASVAGSTVGSGFAGGFAIRFAGDHRRRGGSGGRIHMAGDRAGRAGSGALPPHHAGVREFEAWRRSSPPGSTTCMHRIMAPMPCRRSHRRGAVGFPGITIPWSAPRRCWFGLTMTGTSSRYFITGRCPRSGASGSRNSSNMACCVAWWPPAAWNWASTWGRWIW